jgi:hypothetical protein
MLFSRCARMLLGIGLLTVSPTASAHPHKQPGDTPAPAAARSDPIVAEARAFMEAYARDLVGGNREALTARYDRRGAWRVGSGQKALDSFDAIRAFYSGPWSPPEAFAWVDMSFEPLGPDAIVIVSKFLWTDRGAKAPRTISYTGLLVRQDGELRIRLEDEDAAPSS